MIPTPEDVWHFLRDTVRRTWRGLTRRRRPHDEIPPLLPFPQHVAALVSSALGGSLVVLLAAGLIGVTAFWEVTAAFSHFAMWSKGLEGGSIWLGFAALLRASSLGMMTFAALSIAHNVRRLARLAMQTEMNLAMIKATERTGQVVPTLRFHGPFLREIAFGDFMLPGGQVSRFQIAKLEGLPFPPVQMRIDGTAEDGGVDVHAVIEFDFVEGTVTTVEAPTEDLWVRQFSMSPVRDDEPRIGSY